MSYQQEYQGIVVPIQIAARQMLEAECSSFDNHERRGFKKPRTRNAFAEKDSRAARSAASLLRRTAR